MAPVTYRLYMIKQRHSCKPSEQSNYDKFQQLYIRTHCISPLVAKAVLASAI